MTSTENNGVAWKNLKFPRFKIGEYVEQIPEHRSQHNEPVKGEIVAEEHYRNNVYMYWVKTEPSKALCETNYHLVSVKNKIK